MSESEVKRLKAENARLTAELEGLRGRIAKRVPLAMLRDHNANVNMRKKPDLTGYTPLNGEHVSRAAKSLGVPFAVCGSYGGPPSFFFSAGGIVVEEEFGRAVAELAEIFDRDYSMSLKRDLVEAWKAARPEFQKVKS